MTGRKYLFDTNIITGRALVTMRRLPAGEHFSCVVLSEVMTAADPKPFRAYVETWKRAVEDGRLIVPHPDDWLPAARTLHLLAQERKKSAGGKSPARTAAAKQEVFADVLIALSAARVGVAVVTDDADFQAIIAFSEAVEQDEDEDDNEAGAESSAQALPGVERESQIDEADEYTGYKWGIFLRAPEIFFKLLRRGSDYFIPLGQIAQVRFGIKSGCDAFFFPIDTTDEALASDLSDYDFKDNHGIGRSQTKKIRIVKTGDGVRHLVEARYLEPEAHSIIKLSSIEINVDTLARKILLVSLPKEKLKDQYVLKYILWGEEQEFHQRPTCQSRSQSRPWYDLAPAPAGAIFWPLAHQYRHIIPLNSQRIISNKRLFNVYPTESVDELTLCAVLNSTLVALTKIYFGRFVGREGNLDTEVFDTKMMLIPDPRRATPRIHRKLEKALNAMRQRMSLQLVEVDSDEAGWTGELALEDRQQLDDAVLELLGVANKQEREQLRAELYEEITTLYRQIRAAEREMQHHRSATARQGRATAQSIAAEIWESLDARPAYRTPLDFVPPRVRTETVNLPVEGRARIVPGDMFHPDSVQIGETAIELGDPARCEFVKELSRVGISGSVPVPVQPEHCFNALREHQTYADETNTTFQGFAAAYTADEHTQERVIKELWRKLKS